MKPTQRYFLYQPVTAKWALHRKQERSSEYRFISDTRISWGRVYGELWEQGSSADSSRGRGLYSSRPDRATQHDPVSKSKSNKQKISMEQVKAKNHLIFLPSALKLCLTLTVSI